MIDKFDIDFVVNKFQVTNLKYYLDLIHNASNYDLHLLKKEIKTHKKLNRQHQAFTDVINFSTHDAIISAINYESLKRSIFYPLYKLIFQIRRPIVKTFTGLDLKEDEYFGTLYTQPGYLDHRYLHMPHYALIPIFGKLLATNWKIIVYSILTIIGFYIAWLKR